MFGGLRILWLEFRLDRLRRHYRRLYAERKATGVEDKGDDYGLQPDWYYGEGLLEEEIDHLFASSLEGEARRLRVPVPPKPAGNGNDNEWWSPPEFIPGNWCLTEEGTLRLRTAIRAERKERRDAILAWAPIVSATTGLVGVVTALVLALARR